ncbi:hypothetical protein PLICRDRAFT_45998 [Plicaturopsis crispa FD-325 SS-3]|uniref:Uncharacterized protein n=1 Tax=Plicaturopsis crispa FD-325 SS-3 TaxID=944288 RepID=A0A0C9T8R2_PLICR|nr:hypothetical protein PLICRDRAFT_45998 [Plicaturopsis crispa FD-325 SS-3]
MPQTRRFDENYFANLSFGVGTPPQTPSPAKQPSTPRGYFAFPPGSSRSARAERDPLTDAADGNERSGEARRPGKGGLPADAARDEQEARARHIQREKEIEIASAGEIEWVRSGGVLRDAQGRRDKVRTAQILAEIRLVEEEQRLTAVWEEHERRWRTLLASHDDVLTFRDIPWPLHPPPSSPADLVPAKITEFLLAPLRVRSCTVSKRDRLRTAMLRWHPDKITPLLSDRVAEDDAGAVRDGINVVFNACLGALHA